MIKKFIIIAAVALLCNGQLLDLVLPVIPEIAKTTLDVVDRIGKSSLVSIASQTSGDLIAAGVQALTWLPETATRALGVGSRIGLLPDSNTNVYGALDDFIDDYKAGLGNEDANLDFRAIVRKYNYPLEQHDVITEDGFILSVFRIPSNGSAVFLMHGLLGCSDDYIVAGPVSGLAYLLANEGYDVWIGNARGNKHSRRHIYLTPSEAEFWDFSWHEIGIFDLPAMIDSVLEETDATSLKYIGHSQGTTSFFVMTSERPEYNKKVSMMVALSPVAFMSNVRSPVVRLLAPGTPFIHSFFKTVGLYEFLPDNSLMRTLKLVMCGGSGLVSELVCSNVIFMMGGLGYEQFNFTNLPVLLGHTPAGASAKQVAHYGQGVLTGEFRQFDYGTGGNVEKYGAQTPPSYALENIRTPISLFYSEADWLAHPADVDKLYKKLRGSVNIYKIPHQQFNHFDFLWAKDFQELVYKRLRELLT